MPTALSALQTGRENWPAIKTPYAKWADCSGLFREPAWGPMKLKPLPIFRDESRHQYCWEPTGEWLAYSTTQITGANKSPEALANIERYKHIWQPRGVKVHWCLAEKMLGNDDPDYGNYEDWVKPLLSDPFWEVFEPWAVEYMLCDLDKSVGGQFDLLGFDHREEKLVLLDLKTQSRTNAKPYNTDAQLGSYVDALANHHKIVVDDCKTIWARPNKCVVGGSQDPLTCRLAWEDSWKEFSNEQESI